MTKIFNSEGVASGVRDLNRLKFAEMFDGDATPSELGFVRLIYPGLTELNLGFEAKRFQRF
jgi:hypothetical protein